MDKKEILEALGGIPEDVYDAIVASFYDEVRSKLDPLKAAIAGNDALTFSKIGHGIKGSAANLRLEDISAVGKKIEMAGKSGDSASFKGLYDELTKLIL